MEKKVTAQGPKDRKSYTVTLPIEWAKKEKIDKNKSVDLAVIGNKIIISSSKDIDERVVVDAEQYKHSLIKVIQGLYRVGINEIKFCFSDNKDLEKVLSIIEQYLIGYEVIERKKDYLIIKDITKESEEDFKIIFRRIFLLLIELSECDDHSQMGSFDRNIKKLINYCQRILMKKGHSEFVKVPLYYMILDRLEKLSDEYRWISQLKQFKRNDTLKEISGLLRTIYELFYKFEPLKYDKNSIESYNLRNKIKLGTNVDTMTIHLHNLSRIINSLSSDIFALKFDFKEN